MANGLSTSGQEPVEIIPIHFNVPGHHLPLETFIETAEQTKAVIAAFNEELFKGKLEYELLVLPPEFGTFKSMLGFAVITWGVVWSFTESDIGKAFVKGLTGREPAEWAEIAGQVIKKELIDTTEASEPEVKGEEVERRVKHRAETVILAEATKSFLQKDVSELSRIGIRPQKFRDAYEARNAFYRACSENASLQGIGFNETEDFPITRSDFAKLQVVLPPKEEEPNERPWRTETMVLKVTSPNWDRDDKQRQWKGKDPYGRERYFRIEDEHFWHLVKNEQINPHIIDTIKVQWAFHEEEGRQKDAMVLIILEYNGDILSDPLDENALNAILGQYERGLSRGGQGNLFND